MSKIIAFFRIVKLETSPRCTKEIVVFIEIVLMFLLLEIVIVPINNSIMLTNGFEHSITDYDNLIYYTQNYAGNKSISVSEIVDTVGEKVRIYRSSHSLAKTGDNKSLLLLVLSEDLFSDVYINLSLGNKEEGKVLISPHMSEQYSIGDSIWVNAENYSGELVVSGILDKYSIITDIHQISGSTKAIYALCNSIVESKDKDFIIMCEPPHCLLSQTCEALAMIVPDSADISGIVEKLNGTYSDIGEFYSYKQLKQFEFEKTLNNLSWEKVFFLLITITTLFSIIGYAVVNIRQKHHLNAILNICGLSQKKLMLIVGVYIFLIITPGIIVGMILSPMVFDEIRLVYYGFSSILMSVIIVAIGIILIVGICIANSIIKNLSIIKRYKV